MDEAHVRLTTIDEPRCWSGYVSLQEIKPLRSAHGRCIVQLSSYRSKTWPRPLYDTVRFRVPKVSAIQATTGWLPFEPQGGR